jgi:hypothetical protein
VTDAPDDDESLRELANKLRDITLETDRREAVRMGHRVRVVWNASLDNPGDTVQCLALLDGGDVPELRLLDEAEIGAHMNGDAPLPDDPGRWVCNYRHEALSLARALIEAAMQLPEDER